MWLERKLAKQNNQRTLRSNSKTNSQFSWSSEAPNVNKKHKSEDEVVKTEQEESHYRSVKTKLTCVQDVKSREIYRRDISKNWSQTRENGGNHTWQRQLLVRGRRPPLQNLQC